MRITSLVLCGLAAVALGCGSGDGNTTPDLGVATVAITPASPDTLFSVNDTVKLAASARDKSGAAVAGATVSWSSSANGVATVDDQGVVVAVSNGTAAITATAKGISSTPVTIRVRQKLASVTLAPATPTVQIARTVTLVATGKDARGTALTTPAPTWSSSNDNVATVNSMGVVTGAGLGQATITATVVSTADGTRTATTVVTVSATPPSTATVTMGPMSFAPAQTEIAVGGTVTWVNDSGIQHDVDFGTGQAQHIAVWSSGSRSLTFAAAGTFMYFCNLHAGMTGTVVVR